MISEQLKILRFSKNLTQQQIADNLEISRARYNNYETGKRIPKDDIKVRIATYYGVSIDYLIGRTDNPTPYSNNNQIHLKDRIKELRTTYELTAKEFGKEFNIAESTVSLYESGKRTPNKDLLIEIADYFHISTDYLLGRTNNPAPYVKPKTKINNNHIDEKLNEFINEVKKTDGLIYKGRLMDEPTRRVLIKMLKTTKDMVEEINSK